MKLFIQTMGCPKNVNDSQVAAGILEDSGHEVVETPEEADALMLNTCGFIEDAKTESIAEIFRLANMGKLLIVSGCLVQRYSNELFDEIPEVDIFLGVNDYDKLPEILEKHVPGKRDKVVNPFEKELETKLRKLNGNEDHIHTETIKIAEGCDNRCTYCIIPKIRGPYRSRPMNLIVEEAKRLADAGTKEIVLIAQDTSAWGIDIYGEYKLPMLLRELCKIDGIEWIRLMYCYEERITDELIQTIAEEPKVCNYIDIPLQHASDKVLRAMARKSTNESIYDTINKLRCAIPDMHIRTTLITGFPGEDEADFRDLMDLTENVRFERLGVFTYSQEEGTKAATMENQIPQEVKEERCDAIMRRQLDISLALNQSKVGKTMRIMLDELQEDGSWLGRSEYDAPEIDCAVIVRTEKEHRPGDMVWVRMEDAFDYDLAGVEVEA